MEARQEGSMTSEIQTILAELRRGLEALYRERLVRILLFGSHARNEAESGSDLDVLIVLRGPVAPGEEVGRVSPLASELSLRYNVVLSCIFMDEARFAIRQGPLLRNIRREGIPV